MSTHSIIGVKTPEGFEGKYCHFDGYPTGVGYSILNAIDYFGLKDAIDVLTKKHKSGWSSIAGCDWSIKPTYDTPDVNVETPRCNCHGDLGQNWEGNDVVAVDETLTHECEIICDWAYIFDVPKGRVRYPKLIVYSNRWDKGEWTEQMVLDLWKHPEGLRKQLLELEESQKKSYV